MELLSFVADTDTTLVRAAGKALPDFPYSALRAALRRRDVKVNGVRTSGDMPLKSGDRVEIYSSGTASSGKEQDPDKHGKASWTLVYEDAATVIIHKPAGVETERLVSALGFYAVHRLDRNTAGLLAAAKTLESKELLDRCFRERLVKKYYLAVLTAVPKPKSATITGYLVKNAEKARVKVYGEPVKDGKKIVTAYRVIQEFAKNAGEKQTNDAAAGACLVEIELLTGRTHQIRAHMAYIGCPVAGDGKYGRGDGKQQLVAYKIQFCLPEGHPLCYLNDLKLELPEAHGILNN
ncbi:MAG: RluA family pseudouridine synthase [Firmicutes bacterium]|nr:RluA family pseudouridine synthase [Bacillota bacterium]